MLDERAFALRSRRRRFNSDTRGGFLCFSVIAHA
jgi:hypothetical protein